MLRFSWRQRSGLGFTERIPVLCQAWTKGGQGFNCAWSGRKNQHRAGSLVKEPRTGLCPAVVANGAIRLP